MNINKLIELGRQDAELADTTERDLRSTWSNFESWCHRHDRVPLPATPDSVNEYLVDIAGRLSVGSLRRVLWAINYMHERAGEDSPTRHEDVRNALDGITVLKGLMPETTTEIIEMDPALHPDVRAMALAQPEDTTIGLREKALLLAGAAASMSRKEIVELTVDQVELYDDRTVFHLEGGSPSRVITVPRADARIDPGVALRAWTRHAEIKDGLYFRRIDRWGNAYEDGLSEQSLTDVLRRASRLADLPETITSTKVFTWHRPTDNPS